MIGRRDFLRSLVLGAAGLAIPDPERLLWTPGEKTIILPPAGGWVTGVDWSRGNSFITMGWVTNEALKVFQNNIAFAGYINREYYRCTFSEEFIRPAVRD